jgi:invasion protein IalB
MTANVQITVEIQVEVPSEVIAGLLAKGVPPDDAIEIAARKAAEEHMIAKLTSTYGEWFHVCRSQLMHTEPVQA